MFQNKKLLFISNRSEKLTRDGFYVRMHTFFHVKVIQNREVGQPAKIPFGSRNF